MKIGPIEITKEELEHFFEYLIFVAIIAIVYFAWATSVINQYYAIIGFIAVVIVFISYRYYQKVKKIIRCPYCTSVEYKLHAWDEDEFYIYQCLEKACNKNFKQSTRTKKIYKDDTHANLKRTYKE